MVDLFDRSPVGLMDALCKRLESVLASFWQVNEFGDEHEPHVHVQYLPVTKTEDKERDKSKDYPIAQVVCNGGKITSFSPAENGSEISIDIYFGAWQNTTDNQGWRLPASMLWRVAQDLEGNTLVNGYQLVTPIEWSTLNTKEPPYYTAVIKTKWRGAAPSIETPTELEGSLDLDLDEKSGVIF